MNRQEFKNLARALELIKFSSGTLQKQSYLIRLANMPMLKAALRHLYDPYTNTGLKDKSLALAYHSVVGIPAIFDDDCLTIEEFLQHITNNNTGANTAIEYAGMALHWAEEIDDASYQLMEGLLTKNFQIGVKATTLNKVYGTGFIPIVGIYRGKHAPSSFCGTYIATEKIDGNRRLIMNKESGVEIYTRSGRRDYGLVELEYEAEHYLPKGYVYDTECVAIGDFTDNVAERQASASLLNKKGTRTGVMSKIFDMVKQEEYDNGISTETAVSRKLRLAMLFEDYTGIEILHNELRSELNIAAFKESGRRCRFFMALPILGIVHDMKQAQALARPVWDRKGEGLMLNEFNSPYEVSPNPRNTLLKIKAVDDFEVKCIGVTEGTNSNEGSLGAIVVEYTSPTDGRDYTFSVGSGFTQEDRNYYWTYPEEIIGKIVEIESFGESLNKQGQRALNCPIFKRIKGDYHNG